MATVEFTPRCLQEDFEEISEKDEDAIIEKAQLLAVNPEFGKPLTGDFAGLRRLTCGRYRIVYRHHRESDTCFILMVGLRMEGDADDVYAKATRLLRVGRLQAAAEQLRAAEERNRKFLDNIKTQMTEKQREKGPKRRQK